jgi:ribosome biogenesis SPOUT family RNA methylase Rps3
MESSSKYYIIDHQEEGLLDWCTSEYLQIMKYLKSSKSKALITNAGTFNNTIDCDEKTVEKIKLCNQNLKDQIVTQNQTDKFQLVDEPLNNIIKAQNDKFILIPSENKLIEGKRVCLLDLRATKELSPSDANDFDVFIFGGILGDHPPKDRTSYLRAEGFDTRHLGAIQMSTDTAVLTSKLILECGISIDKIPFIVEPEFFKKEKKGNLEESVCMEGFRFISDEIDYDTGLIVKKDNPKPLGHPTIYENLIFEEFDFSII